MKTIIRSAAEFEALLTSFEEETKTDLEIALTAHDPRNETFKANPNGLDYDDEKYRLSKENIVDLFKLIEKKGITSLTLTQGLVGKEALPSLAKGLKANKTIKKLDLSENELNEKQVGLLGDALVSNNTVEMLIFRNNGHCGSLIRGIRSCHSIKVCDLSLTSTGDDGRRLLWESEETLFKDEASHRTFVSMMLDSSIQKLYLAGNRINERMAGEFRRVFKQNQVLEELDLEDCFLGVHPLALEFF